jgi:putative membrane protein
MSETTVLNPSVTEAAWRAPDPRTIAVRCAWLAAPAGSAAFTALATGGRFDLRAWITLGAIAVTFVVITLIGLVRWRRTSYRVTPEFFELRSGVLTRRFRSVPLRRIRNIDLTANPLHRLVGLTVVRIGTAGSTGGRDELRLEALSKDAAEGLRRELLWHTGPPREEPTLSTMDMRWVRYAPLTFWAFGGVFVAAGTVYRILNDVGIELWRVGFVRRAFEAFGASALWLTIPLVLLAIAVLGGVGATALFVENWWHFRLEWSETGTLRVRRGLLTTRSVSIERRQLRGVLLREPLMLRWGGGAKAAAVAGGLGDDDENRRRSALLPPAPRAEALRVVGGVAGRPVFDRALNPHPPVARRRRVLRGMSLVVLPVTVLTAVAGVLLTPVLLYCALGFLLVASPIAVLLGLDAYRNLGHALDDEFLLARSGTFSRDSLALRRDSVVAWSFSSSPFARKAGVLTLTAAVAAGEQGYRIPDLGAGYAAGFADEAAPGILTEFLEPAYVR